MAGGDGDQGRPAKGYAMRALLGITNSIAVVLGAGCCSLLGMLPLAAVLIFLRDPQYYPTYLLAAVLSAPGLAALFAIYRDHPGLSSASARARRQALDSMTERGHTLPDWIAKPYVDSGTVYGFFRAYWRAYKVLALRSWATWLPLGLIAFALIYDLQIASQLSWGQILFLPILVCLLLLVQTALVSLVLLVEYPRARIRKVLINGILLSVRRWYMMVLSLAVLAGYVWGLMRSPILVALLATGLIWYLVWAAVRWQADPFFQQMARESGDPGVQAMYGLPDTGAKGSSFTALQDYRQ